MIEQKDKSSTPLLVSRYTGAGKPDHLSLVNRTNYPELHKDSAPGRYVVQLRAICFAHWDSGIYKLWRFWFEDEIDAKCFINVYMLVADSKLLVTTASSTKCDTSEDSSTSSVSESRSSKDSVESDEEDVDLLLENDNDFVNMQEEHWPIKPFMPKPHTPAADTSVC